MLSNIFQFQTCPHLAIKWQKDERFRNDWKVKTPCIESFYVAFSIQFNSIPLPWTQTPRWLTGWLMLFWVIHPQLSKYFSHAFKITNSVDHYYFPVMQWNFQSGKKNHSYSSYHFCQTTFLNSEILRFWRNEKEMSVVIWIIYCLLLTHWTAYNLLSHQWDQMSFVGNNLFLLWTYEADLLSPLLRFIDYNYGCMYSFLLCNGYLLTTSIIFLLVCFVWAECMEWTHVSFHPAQPSPHPRPVSSFQFPTKWIEWTSKFQVQRKFSTKYPNGEVSNSFYLFIKIYKLWGNIMYLIEVRTSKKKVHHLCMFQEKCFRLVELFASLGLSSFIVNELSLILHFSSFPSYNTMLCFIASKLQTEPRHFIFSKTFSVR